MTTEDAFWAGINACPSDWQARLVFADYLGEQGDPREEGYRALVALKLQPCWAHCGVFSKGSLDAWRMLSPNLHRMFWWCDYTAARLDKFKDLLPYVLPEGWFELHRKFCREADYGVAFDTRKEATDAAALAFGLLPEDKRKLYLEGRLDDVE